MTKQYHLSLPNRCSMKAEDFLPSSANDAAVECLLVREPSEWSSHALVLWGADGSGKTHLLSIWAEKIGAIAVVPGDENLSQVIDGHVALGYVFDDADEIVNDPDAQEWLQHFYNATKTAGVPFLLAASCPPVQWGLTLRDIETRLKSCQAVEIFQPDDDLMRGLLLKLFSDRQLMVESGVVEFLASRLDRTGAVVINAVEALDEAALETKRKISIPFARRVLALDQGEE